MKKKQIVITLDDTPNAPGLFFGPGERIPKIITTLASHHVQSVFFVTAEKVNASNIQLLSFIDQHNQFIGNHSYSHKNTKETDAETYLADIVKAEKILDRFATYRKWFRYPYLDEGSSSEVHTALREGLNKLNYLNYYATVPTYDFYLDDLFQRSLKENKNLNLDRVVDLYVDTIQESVEFYHLLARELFPKPFVHVLLLHENDLTTLCLDALITKLKDDQWSILSPDNALDPVLSRYQPMTFPCRLGKINQAAQDRGIKARFPRVIDENFLDLRWNELLNDPSLS